MARGPSRCRHLSRGGGIARDGHCHCYAFIQGAQENRLPSPAGKPGNPDAIAVHARMVAEVIEPAPHFQQKNSEGIGANQVQMRAVPMLVPLGLQLTKREPLQVQRHDAVLGEIDTPLLLVFDGLPLRADVPIHI